MNSFCHRSDTNAMPQKHYHRPAVLVPNLISKGWMHADQTLLDLKKVVVDVSPSLLNMLFVIKVRCTSHCFISLDDKSNSLKTGVKS